MSRDYSKAAAPAPTQILGLKLKPFSLGHVILLKRHDCAFVADDERQATIEDLITGVLICSMTWDEWERFSESDDFNKAIAKWGKTASKAVRKDKEFSILHRFRLFNEYIRDASKMPPVWVEKETEPSGGSDWFQNVKLTLTSQLGYSNAEALNCPLGQALLDYCKYAESQGILRIMTAEEVALTEANNVNA